jgi:hypothetical protein
MKTTLGVRIGMGLLLLLLAACASVTPHDALMNSQTRLQQEGKGYQDPARGQEDDAEARGKLGALVNEKQKR